MKIDRGILVVALVAIWLIAGNNAVDARDVGGNGRENGGYDRLELLSRFLRGVYPDLVDKQGLSTLQIAFTSGVFELTSVNFEFHPCRMSGVSLEAAALPYCGAPSSVGDKPFLGATVDFGTDKRRPIRSFTASGSLVDDNRLRDIRRQFDGSWKEDDALRALQSANPIYGPEHKKEFIASLPIRDIQDVAGCRLRPESAEFVVKLWGTLPPELQWTVRGDAAATQMLNEKTDCWASFEPFAGRMTAMGGFAQ
jgi:hypothetical protein